MKMTMIIIIWRLGPRKRGFITSVRFLAAIFLILFTGCKVGPDYIPPETSAEMDTWQQQLEAGLVTSEADISYWWQNLNDSKLNALIKRAMKGSIDLGQARSRVREARAQRGIAAASRFPTIVSTGSATRTEQEDLPDTELFTTGFDAAWELDIFGRVARSVEANTADVEAKIEALGDVQVTLLAEVALNYIEVRSFQIRLKLAQANVAAQQKTLELVRVRFEAGLSNTLEVKQAESNLSNSQSQIPPLEVGMRRAKNRLAVLLGEKPGALNDFFSEPAPIPMAPAEIAIGIPADLMRRRPDIREAERELAAQTARVGVAMADLYPRFTLNGTLTFQSSKATNLFSTFSRILGVGPAFQWNIFNAGSVRSNIKVQNERQKQALLAYEKAVLTALEDVENAITAYARELDRRESLRQAADASRKSVELAQGLYKDGLRDFIHVLDAQRSLFSQEDQLATSNANVTSNLIRLYKGLGGGWKAHTN